MKKLLSCLMCSAMILSSGIIANAEGGNVKVERISGKSRYVTPVEISKKYYKSSDTAVIASGEGFADALVGGSLVSQRKLPMFLSSKNSISNDVKDELVRLKVKKVYILGGNGSVSANVEGQIKKLGANVVRLAGKNRFDTASKIAEERYKLSPNINREAIGDSYVGINAYNYADALVAGSLVGQLKNFSLILPYQNIFSGDNNPGYEIVFGGFSSVPNIADVSMRIAGQNRFATSVEAAKKFENLTGKKLKTVILVDGTNYPDALAASTVAGNENAAVITTSPNKLYKEAKKFIKNNGIEKVIIIGGEKSVSKEVENEINDGEDLSAQKLGGWTVDGKDKYYYENGAKVTGWKKIDGNKYFFNGDGAVQTGWHVEKYSDSTGTHDVRYYLNKDGSLAQEGTEVDGWITSSNGISVLNYDTEKNKIKDFLRTNKPDIAEKINSKQMVIFKDSKSDGAYDYYNISNTSDYWHTNIGGVENEGSNNILSKIKIDRYSGSVEFAK